MIGDVGGILVRGRELAVGKMRATVVIRREGEKVRNPETGQLEPSLTVIYPEGIAEVRISDLSPNGGDASGQRFAEQRPHLALPMVGEFADAAAAVEFEDVGEVIADPDNPGNVGVRFRIAGVHVKSLNTARRLPIAVLSFA